MKTIDITPTWKAVLPILIAALENGKKIVCEELQRMAEAADLYNASVKQP